MGAADGRCGCGEESEQRMNYSLGYAKGTAGLSFALGTITRDRKVFKPSGEELSVCVESAIRTLLKEQPELFDKLSSFDWSTVEAVANSDGTIAICDRNNHDTVRLLLPEALTLQTLRDTIRQIQETIDGVADALDAI